MLNELWRPISNTYYAVSDRGRVQNMLTEDILEPYMFGVDYRLRVNLDGRWIPIDSLVAEAFLCCLDCADWDILHLDGNPSNNTHTNLYLKEAECSLF